MITDVTIQMIEKLERIRHYIVFDAPVDDFEAAVAARDIIVQAEYAVAIG